MHEPHLPPAPAPPLPFEPEQLVPPTLSPPPFAPPAFVPAVPNGEVGGVVVAPGEPVTMRAVARDVWAMMQHPRELLPRAAQPWRVWARVVGLYIIGMFVAGSVAALGIWASGATHELDNMRRNMDKLGGPIGLIVMAGVVAPLWEEAAFRLPLGAFHAGRVLFALGLGIAFLNASSAQGGPNLLSSGFLASVPMMVAFVVALATLVAKPLREPVALWWSKHFGWVLGLSVLCFGFAHAGNYQYKSALSVLAAPLLVMPQMVAGVLLAYVRLKLGFWYGVALHASVNTALMLAFLSSPSPAPNPNGTKPKPRPGRQQPVSLRIAAPFVAAPGTVAR